MSVITSRRIAAVVTAAAVLGVSACGSDDNSTATSASGAAKESAQVPSALVGQWTRVMSKADVKRTQSFREDYGPGQSAPSPGAQLMTIEEATPAARLAIEEPGSGYPPIAEDIVANPVGELRLMSYVNTKNGTFCSYAVPVPAHYSWKVTGDSLTLKPVREGCADRDSTLTGSWTRK